MVSATTTNQGCHLQDRCSLHVRVYPNHFDVFFFYLMEKRKNVESEMKSKSFEIVNWKGRISWMDKTIKVKQVWVVWIRKSLVVKWHFLGGFLNKLNFKKKNEKTSRDKSVFWSIQFHNFLLFDEMNQIKPKKKR